MKYVHVTYDYCNMKDTFDKHHMVNRITNICIVNIVHITLLANQSQSTTTQTMGNILSENRLK